MCLNLEKILNRQERLNKMKSINYYIILHQSIIISSCNNSKSSGSTDGFLRQNLDFQLEKSQNLFCYVEIAIF